MKTVKAATGPDVDWMQPMNSIRLRRNYSSVVAFFPWFCFGQVGRKKRRLDVAYGNENGSLSGVPRSRAERTARIIDQHLAQVSSTALSRRPPVPRLDWTANGSRHRRRRWTTSRSPAPYVRLRFANKRMVGKKMPLLYWPLLNSEAVHCPFCLNKVTVMDVTCSLESDLLI